MEKKKLGIIGASYLQAPLIQKAKDMGIETHVFAWAANDIGEEIADFFYPISIVDKEEILEKCKDLRIDGICTIASDLAAITVGYIADKMNLIGNTWDCVITSTNKHLMRMRFDEKQDPSPKSLQVFSAEDLKGKKLQYPVIIKPSDRSGSRGITKVYSEKKLTKAVDYALSQSFEKTALVEEYAEGQEYSVEYISFEGKHYFLALTHKYTTGAPHFVETGHLEPAPVSDERLARIQAVVSHALNSLGIQYGASHTELKIDSNGIIRLIEIGGRMGGDFIGSDLVYLSTGIDFVGDVIRIALGMKPDIKAQWNRAAAVRFIVGKPDLIALEKLKKEHPEYLIREEIKELMNEEVLDSSSRFGYYLMSADSAEELIPYMPETQEE